MLHQMEDQKQSQNLRYCNIFSLQTSSQNKSPFTTSSSSSSNEQSVSSLSRHSNSGISNEQVLSLIFRQLNWDPQSLCSLSCTSRRLRAVSERVLFFELCKSRAPKLVSSLVVTPNSNSPRVPGGWPAMAKLLLFCFGCNNLKFFEGSNEGVEGHFAPVSRFSKTSGKSFLRKNCWGDVLYVSDPCEHASPNGEEMDLGAYRGVFCGFVRSRTRACLVRKHIQLEARVRCPYCSARVWNMTAAGLVPKSASRRLGAHQDMLEYFVCVNGHLHGNCCLAHLSSSEDDEPAEEEEEDSDDVEETTTW